MFQGVICHPYLSLQYYDLLQDPNVRGFVAGASNILYKQKRNALDVIVEVSPGLKSYKKKTKKKTNKKNSCTVPGASIRGNTVC